MKLTSCHIENFGKLNNQTFSFDASSGASSGINVLCENNGWGKSTLAAFIKVMFFGFDNEGRRNNVENERQRYKPWQGGSYGGWLAFETDGKGYIISRTFGAKEKDDEFLLQDAETKLASTNFSKNIGEELFQIDSASFARSIYISQNDCVTATTDRINAKLGNLADSTDDLNNYETAARKIADKLNALSKTRKTGELYKQKEQIEMLKQEVKKGAAIDASMEELMKFKNDLHDSYEALKEERKQLQSRQKAVSRYKDILVKKQEYDRLCADEAKKKKLYGEKKAQFPVRVPESGEIDRHIELEYRTSVLRKNLDFNKLDDGERRELGRLEDRFGLGVPGNAEIEAVKDKVSDMQTLRRNIDKNMLTEDEDRTLTRLGELFADGVPAAEEFDSASKAWSVRSEKKNTLSSKQAAADMLKMVEKENAQNAQHPHPKPLLPAALLFAVALAALSAVAALGCRLFAVMTPLAGIGILAADIAAALIFAAAVAARKKKRMKNRTKDHETSAPYLNLEREIAADEELIRKTETDTKQFLSRYGIAYEESSVTSDLYQLKEDVKLYGRLLEKSQNADAGGLRERYNALLDEVEGFVQKYGFGMDDEERNAYRAAAAGNLGLSGSTDIMSNAKVKAGIEAADMTVYYVNLLHGLESSIDKYTALKNKKGSFEKSYEEYQNNMEVLRAFIEEIGLQGAGIEEAEIKGADVKGREIEGIDVNGTGINDADVNGTDRDFHIEVQHIKDAQRGCLDSEREYKEAVLAKSEYERENSDFLDEIKNTEIVGEDGSLAEIELRLGEISAEIEKYHTNMAAYDRQLDEFQEKRDEITDAENRLYELQEVYGLNEKKLKTLQDTQKYLEQAKISLTAKYTRPIKEGFDKYMEILCDIESENYQLDANLDMSLLEQGLPRKTVFLSAGYQDMIGICMRMALIDAMYKGEKPFVIFDDPFVNLDGDRTKGALKLLDMIAKEYQVLYFTCNESRR